MNNDLLVEPLNRKGLSFLKRNSIFIYGLLIIFFMVGLIVLGWTTIQRKAKWRISSSVKDGQIIAPNEEPLLKQKTTSLNQLSIGSSVASLQAKQNDFVLVEIPEDKAEAAKFRALDNLQHFAAATTWMDKLPYVHDSNRVRPLMKRFYEDQKQRGKKIGSPDSISFYRLGALQIQHIVCNTTSTDGQLELAMRLEPSGDFLLDWESYVGASAMDWTDFKKLKPTVNTLFRVYAIENDYFNFEFSDNSRFICLKLLSSDNTETLYAYCDKDSGVANELKKLLINDSSVPLTLMLAFPENAKSNNCVHLREIVANRWLLP
jgi:hypothetical protein